MDSCKGFLFVVAWSRMGKSSQPSRWHRVRKRREARGEGKVSKYEMRIIIRAYLLHRECNVVLRFSGTPRVYLSIGLCPSLLRLPFMAYEPYNPPRPLVIQRPPNCCFIQRCDAKFASSHCNCLDRTRDEW